MENSIYFIKEYFRIGSAGCVFTLPTPINTGTWKVTLENAFLSYSAIDKDKADLETLWLNKNAIDIFYSTFSIIASFTTNGKSSLGNNILGELPPTDSNRPGNATNWAIFKNPEKTIYWGTIKNTSTITLSIKDGRGVVIQHFEDVNGSYMQSNLTAEKLRATPIIIILKFEKIV